MLASSPPVRAPRTRYARTVPRAARAAPCGRARAAGGDGGAGARVPADCQVPAAGGRVGGAGRGGAGRCKLQPLPPNQWSLSAQSAPPLLSRHAGTKGAKPPGPSRPLPAPPGPAARRPAFWQLLAAGDRDAVHPLLRWLLSQGGLLTKRAFVGHHLTFPQVRAPHGPSSLDGPHRRTAPSLPPRAAALLSVAHSSIRLVCHPHTHCPVRHRPAALRPTQHKLSKGLHSHQHARPPMARPPRCRRSWPTTRAWQT